MIRLLWLASYPKSGNTWFRAFLANLLWAHDEPVDINAMGSGPIASARKLFDDEVGVAASDLTSPEVVRLRPRVYEQLTRHGEGFLCMKIHDAYGHGPEGEPLFAPPGAAGAVYLIRNPLDVAVSYAHHGNVSVDRCIELMGNPRHQLSPRAGGLPIQLPQRLLTWSQHVLSWVDNPDVPVHVVRYEDLHARPFETFREAVLFAELPDDPERIEKAIAFSRFEKLQAQEREKGFREKPLGAESFFRKGRAGDWRNVLTRQQWERVVSDHGEVMERFGYLAASRWTEEEPQPLAAS